MLHFSFVLMIICLLVSTTGASLKGSAATAKRQNIIADRENLSRIEDDAMLKKMKKGKLLVSLPETWTVVVDSRLEEKRRYCRPWTGKFLKDFGRDFYGKFKIPIKVNSAVRTKADQRILRKVNGNAGAVEGPKASSHLTGATVDIAKLGLNNEQLEWMRKRLLALEKKGVIEAIEEHRQAVFHVMVFKKYLPAPSKTKPKTETKIKSKPKRTAALDSRADFFYHIFDEKLLGFARFLLSVIFRNVLMQISGNISVLIRS